MRTTYEFTISVNHPADTNAYGSLHQASTAKRGGTIAVDGEFDAAAVLKEIADQVGAAMSQVSLGLQSRELEVQAERQEAAAKVERERQEREARRL